MTVFHVEQVLILVGGGCSKPGRSRGIGAWTFAGNGRQRSFAALQVFHVEQVSRKVQPVRESSQVFHVEHLGPVIPPNRLGTRRLA